MLLTSAAESALLGRIANGRSHDLPQIIRAHLQDLLPFTQRKVPDPLAELRVRDGTGRRLDTSDQARPRSPARQLGIRFCQCGLECGGFQTNGDARSIRLHSCRLLVLPFQ